MRAWHWSVKIPAREIEVADTLCAAQYMPNCNQGGVLILQETEQPTAYGLNYGSYNAGKNALFAPICAKELQPTMVAKGPGAVENGSGVRRLTPTECARLQGFPDWWCADLGTEHPTDEDITYWQEVFETHRRLVKPEIKPKSRSQINKWLQTPYLDSAEYKLWGNGIALPCAFFVMAGLAWADEETENKSP